MDLDNKIFAYRFLAYTTLAFSAVAILSICVTLPMVYEYANRIKHQINNEAGYCKVCDIINNVFLFVILKLYVKTSASDIWSEIHSMKKINHTREARQAGY
ncbi:unnamed protein product, partial [Strongylus vulgaris]